MDINEAWKRACGILLGDEIGDLEGYRGYLLKHVEPVVKGKSAISGKEVAVPSSEKFSDGATFISNEEAGQYGRWLEKEVALTINEIKDLDSALGALSERLYYSGNVILGNSSNISESTDCIGSHYVHSSWMTKDCKYVAFSSKIRESEFIFGCNDGGVSSFSIKGYGLFWNTRCMEALRSKPVADCYYVANLQGCKNCMFSFNLRNKEYMIGNLQLGKEEYAKLRKKLVEDMRETLLSKKMLPSIVELIAAGGKADGGQKLKARPGALPKPRVGLAPALAPTERAFQKTCEVLFGKKLPPLKECEGWLSEYSAGIIKAESCVSGREVCAPNLEYYRLVKDRLVSQEESLELGKEHLTEREASEISLENAAKMLAGISFTTSEVTMGSDVNMVDSVDYQDAANAYKSSFVFFSKNIGCSFFTRDSESIFGGYTIFFSNHCIRCRNSTNIARCFEVSNSTNCSDSHFLYNCENVKDSMFCFNAKNKKYAIGNMEVGRERYLEFRGKVLGEIAGRVGKEKRLGISVYNLGSLG